MISTCIRHPERHPLLIIREWQIKFCDGNHCAAALLSFFEHWHNWRLDMQIKAAQANRIAQNHGQEGNQDDSLYQFHNAEEIERGLLVLYRRDAIRQARKLLVKKGAISEHGNPSERYKFDKTTYFIFYPEICQRFIDEYYSEAHSSTYAENRTSRAENRNSPPINRNSPPENRISINKTTTEVTTQEDAPSEQRRARENAPAAAPGDTSPLGQQEGQSSSPSHSPADPSLTSQPALPAEPKKSKATRWPDADTPIPDDWKAWAKTERPDLDIELAAACFVDHWVAKPGSGALKLDWKATWRNWVRSEKRQSGSKQGPGFSRQGQLEARNSAALDNWLRTRFGDTATNGAIDGEVDRDA